KYARGSGGSYEACRSPQVIAEGFGIDRPAEVLVALPQPGPDGLRIPESRSDTRSTRNPLGLPPYWSVVGDYSRARVLAYFQTSLDDSAGQSVSLRHGQTRSDRGHICASPNRTGRYPAKTPATN